MPYLARSISQTIESFQIRTNAVNPTVVMTSMGRKNWSDPEVAKPMLDKIPLGKFAGMRTCSYYTSPYTLIIYLKLCSNCMKLLIFIYFRARRCCRCNYISTE